MSITSSGVSITSSGKSIEGSSESVPGSSAPIDSASTPTNLDAKLGDVLAVRDVYARDFDALQLSIGASEKTAGLNANQPMMSGQFDYHVFENGLSMHSVNATEQQNVHSVIELPPSLSFNFIFAGSIEYEFAQQQYLLQPNGDQARCSAIVNSSQEVMKRQMQKGVHVKKVNIFVERKWLELRCHSDADRQSINLLFSKKRVTTWTPSTKIQKKALQLLSLKKAVNFEQEIQAEQLTIQVLVGCLAELSKQTQPSAATLPAQTNGFSPQLKTLINSQLKTHSSVSAVASALGMSDRTLQRKFQKQYGECVSTYIKQRRMETAKIALLIHHKSVGEAAYIAGYKHPSNFINAFKKLTGMTPTEFVRIND